MIEEAHLVCISSMVLFSLFSQTLGSLAQYNILAATPIVYQNLQVQYDALLYVLCEDVLSHGLEFG